MKIAAGVLLVLFITGTAFGEGAGAKASPMGMSSDPKADAVRAYESGRRRLEKAGNIAGELAENTDASKREKLQRNLQKSLEGAAADFRAAVRNNPNLYQAYSELGFALRKLGKYSDSLAAYDKSLAIQPGFSPALEYRAEAYLGLNRIDEAKEAYAILFAGDRPRADVLFKAMEKWVEERRAAPGSIDAAQLEGFATWVEQRATIHATVGTTVKSSEVRSW